ncbi:response regulator [Candidatus Entotheonella palauensis]|uniref:response regulator n=1 Tax=Candidatus Entotheonella palauensis TaxID=93172 RepID=UPI00117761CD|nr:response regulator [Candidatus Entotheonella palauensis]
MMLERFGYEAVCAREGSEVTAAYAMARHLGIPFTVLLLDVNNRLGMGAEETMACLLDLDPNVKAIVCSADYHHPVMKHYSTYGFVAKLEKPFSRKDLIATIGQIKHLCD